jgi:subtilisin
MESGGTASWYIVCSVGGYRPRSVEVTLDTQMKLKKCLWLSFVAFVSVAAKDVTGEEVQPYAIPGQYIVTLKRGHSPVEVARAHGLRPHAHFSRALSGFAGAVPPGRLHALRQDPRVDFIDPDLQLFISAQTLPSGVKRIGAALSGVAKIDGLDERVNADVAVLDTGIAPHSDLNLFRSVSFVPGETNDFNGHGTHVAGIVAALDNDFGVVGVAPGARMWDVKVIDANGFSTTSRLIQGIDYVTQNADQIEVANLSLTGIGYSSSLRQAIINSVAKGVVYVVSAGNDGRDIYGADGVFNTSDDSIPAAYPEVMTVSALSDFDGIASSDDALAAFSNYSLSVTAGNPVSSAGAAIDLAAPGVNIYSTYPGNGYATMSGTSMATPHTAGAAALYVATNGRATNAAGVAAIRQALINSAQPQTAWGSANTLDPDVNHEGLVNAGAIAAPANNPPTVNITAPLTGSSFDFGTTIQFTGSAMDAEDGNRTANLVWTSSIDGQIGTGGSFPKVLTAGTHTVTATVADTGGKTDSRSISVTVRPFNNPPTVNITAPVTGASFDFGTTIQFTGSATDTEDGNRTANLVWTSSIDGQIGTGGSFPKVLTAGTHTVTATVADTGGKTGSRSISVTVRPFNNPPTVNITAPVTGASFDFGTTIQFTGSATDTEDGNRTANLVWTSTIDGQIGTGGSFSKVLTTGTHTITATVADTGGKTDTRSISVTVLPPPPTPVLNVAVVADKPTYVNRNRVYITVTATSGGNRISGVATHLELQTADGNLILRDATTDSYGVARIQYAVSSKRDGIGTYLATITCAKSGYSAGSGTATFDVRK